MGARCAPFALWHAVVQTSAERVGNSDIITTSHDLGSGARPMRVWPGLGWMGGSQSAPSFMCAGRLHSFLGCGGVICSEADSWTLSWRVASGASLSMESHSMWLSEEEADAESRRRRDSVVALACRHACVVAAAGRRGHSLPQRPRAGAASQRRVRASRCTSSQEVGRLGPFPVGGSVACRSRKRPRPLRTPSTQHRMGRVASVWGARPRPRLLGVGMRVWGARLSVSVAVPDSAHFHTPWRVLWPQAVIEGKRGEVTL